MCLEIDSVQWFLVRPKKSSIEWKTGQSRIWSIGIFGRSRIRNWLINSVQDLVGSRLRRRVGWYSVRSSLFIKIKFLGGGVLDSIVSVLTNLEL